MLRSDLQAPNRSEAGFTLAELLIVLTILSLTLAISAPAFGRVLSGRSDQAKLDRFYFSISQARRQAVRTSSEVVFTLNVETGSYRLEGGPLQGQLPEDWAIDAIAARSERSVKEEIGIRYWPGGASTGGEITLSHQGAKTLIKVDWLTGLATREFIE